MSDRFSKQVRSSIMGRIKTADTKPELKLRKMLFHAGLRFRLHRKDLPGRPDIVLPKYKVVIFVHGCFWHRCPTCNLPLPKSNVDFWKRKFERNVERDHEVTLELESKGWRVLVVWECSIMRETDKMIADVRNFLFFNE